MNAPLPTLHDIRLSDGTVIEDVEIESTEPGTRDKKGTLTHEGGVLLRFHSTGRASFLRFSQFSFVFNRRLS